MSKLIDLTNQTFGYWKVLSRGKNSKDGRAKWICECTACGTIKEVDGAHLRAGRTTNCGCIRMEKMRQASIKDETNKTYGFLKVIRIAEKNEKPRQDNSGVYWVCECLKCGRKNVIVKGDYLRNGDTSSCGCLNSKNEAKIAKMLDNLNINYIQQYKYLNYMFDFAIFSKNNELLYFIEYDGIQHFENNHFQNTFNSTRKNDLIKNRYCFENNIPLIRIPYNKKYLISDLLLTSTNFLLTKDNEKEYYK